MKRDRMNDSQITAKLFARATVKTNKESKPRDQILIIIGIGAAQEFSITGVCRDLSILINSLAAYQRPQNLTLEGGAHIGAEFIFVKQLISREGPFLLEIDHGQVGVRTDPDSSLLREQPKQPRRIRGQHLCQGN